MPQLRIRNFIAVPANPAMMQKNFAAALLNPDLPVPREVKGQASRRYAVYRNNVTVSLVRALEANFPAVRRLLGDTYFAGLAREFAQAHPPKSPLMFFYGDVFAGFLEEQSDLADYPYLADVARLEQQWRLSYHEQDAPCLSPEAIAALNDDQLAQLRLTPHPAFALLSSRFAMHSIFLANRGDGTSTANSFADPEYVIISRPHLTVEIQTVSEATFVFFRALVTGETLGAAADVAFQVDANLDLTQCIATLLSVGAFQPLIVQGQ